MIPGSGTQGMIHIVITMDTKTTVASIKKVYSRILGADFEAVTLTAEYNCLQEWGMYGGES